MPETRVWIDTTPVGLRLTVLMPLNRLEFAFGKELADDAPHVLEKHAVALRSYVHEHVRVQSHGMLWAAQAPVMRVIGSDASADLEVELSLQAPTGSNPRQAELLIDAITHEVKTHRILVLLRNDWVGGVLGQAPQLLGELDTTHTRMTLNLPATGSAWSGLWSLAQDGVWHILEGHDHILFLIALLLVSPLTLVSGQWRGTRALGEAARKTAWVVTAFTLGHTLTLILGSCGLLSLPPALIEIAVAITIGIAAIHAIRPLWQHGEAPMAFAFGLVHGQAFSASLDGAGLLWHQHALALLAFNLGIEFIQLLIVCVALPILWWAQSRQGRLGWWLRCTTALMTLGMALWWLTERLPDGSWSDKLQATISSTLICLTPLVLGTWLARNVLSQRHPN